MNNTEIYYKEKYLKYKYKYLELKSIIGGTIPMPPLDPIKQLFKRRLYKKHYSFDKDAKYNLLSPIPIKGTTNTQYYSVIERINGSITTKFEKVHTLGKGRFGAVIQYKNPKNEYIAVKYGTIDQDIHVIDHIKQNKCSEYLVKYIVRTEPPSPCIIMENANGTIKELIPFIQQNITILIDILYEIIIAIKCLQDIGLYYIDIKMENILYHITSDGKIKIILTDLGSISTSDDAKITVTFDPPEYDKNKNYNNNNDEKKYMIPWGIAILILELLNIKEISNIIYKQLYNQRNKDGKTYFLYSSDYINIKLTAIYNLLFSSFPESPTKNFIAKLIKNTLLYDSTKRLPIDEIKTEIESHKPSLKPITTSETHLHK